MTEAYKRRIVLPFAGPLEATDHVLGHELIHAFQYDITGTNVNSNTAGALALPLWFIEGMAEYLSIGPVDPHTAMWMRDAARREKAARDRRPRRSALLPVSLRARALGLHRRQVRRQGGRRRCCAPARSPGVTRRRSRRSSASTPRSSPTLWHEAEFEAYRPVAEATKLAGRIARPVIVNVRTRGRG